MSRVVLSQLVALGAIYWVGQGLGIFLFMAGPITVNQIEFWNSVMWYFYLPLSGLLLCGCFLGMIFTAESKDGHLQFNQSQPWTSGIKFWCTQNQWVAAACMILYFFSIFHLTSTLFKDPRNKSSTTVTAPRP
jgi:heme/copper-type cytochrome/quinol oxidase subunit 2